MMAPYKFTQVSIVLLFALIAGLGTGCSFFQSKTIQYPEDHERYLRIDRAVESFRQAYVKKSSSDLATLMMVGDQLNRLKEEAQGDFDTFSVITLEFVVERIMIEGDDVDVFVHWQGLWRKNVDDSGIRQRGHTRLRWTGTQSILLRGFQGDSPFGVKARLATTISPPSPQKK